MSASAFGFMMVGLMVIVVGIGMVSMAAFSAKILPANGLWYSRTHVNAIKDQVTSGSTNMSGESADALLAPDYWVR